MEASQKSARTRLKSRLTRLGSKVKLKIGEGTKKGVEECLAEMQVAMDDLEALHTQILDKLSADEDIETADSYMTEVQENYTINVSLGKDWLLKLTDSKASIECETKSESVTSFDALRSLSALLSMPKVGLEKFNGDVLKYHSFMTVFDDSVDKVVSEDSAKLTRLLEYTEGSAHQAISSCAILGGTIGYQRARKTLYEKFGDPVKVSQAMMAGLRKNTPVKSLEDFQELSNELINCDCVLTKLGTVNELESQQFLCDVVNRLPLYVIAKWKRYAIDLKEKSARYPLYHELVEFISRETQIQHDPIYGDGGLLHFPKGRKSSLGPEESFKKSGALATGSKVLCYMCNDQHPLYACPQFKELKSVQRLTFIRDKHLCENCFRHDHNANSCPRDKVCGIDGCTLKHSRFLHSAIVNLVQGDNKLVFSEESVSIPYVDVKVNNQIACSALLDTCSTTTFCTKRLAEKLGIRGKPISLELNTLNQKQISETFVVPNLIVSSLIDSNMVILENVCILDHIPVNKTSIDFKRFDHLKSLPFETEVRDIDILIGQDNSEALIPLDVVKGEKGEPFGVKTLLGWSMHGKLEEGATNSISCGLVKGRICKKAMCHFVQHSVVHSSTSNFGVKAEICSPFETSKVVESFDLEAKIERLWSFDNEGLGVADVSMSDQDKDVISLWDKSVQFVKDHYVLPIPWKESVSVPNNYQVALKRLQGLKASLDKKGIYQRYDTEISKLFEKGYAEEVPKSKSGDKIWYLPHHAVITDKKPDKVRVVYDCASKFQGESLNDKCFQGPDLNNKLLHVLLKFRQHEVAFIGDVEAMYYQVKVAEGDRDALRFLWYDKTGNVKHFRMKVHIFGGIWCACIATYAMRRTLQDHNVTNDVAIDTILNCFYVDDCLRSEKTVDQAKSVMCSVKQILAKGGFNLTKFVANRLELIEDLEECDRAKEVKDVSISDDIKSKALGIIWNVKGDRFQISVGESQLEKVKGKVTRRTMLSVLASMYDPLGLVGPFLIVGKKLLQMATKLKLSWDESVSDQIEKEWSGWIQETETLKDLEFDRCMIPLEFQDGIYELHNFCDASENAYGCCSYLRCIKDNKCHVTLIMSKNRLCPIKQISIPRLELQSAVLSAQMNDTIVKQLDVKIEKSYFWTDSQITLSYIKNTSKKLKIYVANRVEIIRNLTDIDQWYHVPTKENPADIISRGGMFVTLNSEFWKRGPKFLQDDFKFGDQGVVDLSDKDPEVKTEKLEASTLTTFVQESNFIDQVIERFSSWEKIKRVVALVLKFVGKLKGAKLGKHVSVEELNLAEVLIIRHVQSSTFGNEIRALKLGQNIPRSSSVRNLFPVLDKDGILCVGGRLQNLGIEFNKHPYLVSHESPVVEKLVREYHERAHLGTEWLLSLLREKFWITKARHVIKGVSRRCVICRKL